MLGKKVVNHCYWHISLTPEQPEEIQQKVTQAEQISGLLPEIDYNVVKYEINGHSISLLNYSDFFDAPFPTLTQSCRIDLSNKRVEKRTYQNSLNPPILHRKELLLSQDHPFVPTYRELTTTAEQLGLFDNPNTIGFRQTWENLIAEKGFQLRDNQFVPIGNVETEHDATDEETENSVIARHLTALSRSNLSAPMQCLARHGFLDGQLSVFDYGCGKGDDIRNLKANNIQVSGWDPHYAPDQPKQPADIVNLGFVINVIENIEERIETLENAYQLSEQLLVVSAMLLNQNAFNGQTYNDGIITQRNTFQKYYTQSELKAFISDTLVIEAIPVAPGIFFAFKDKTAEQRFLLNRQRSRRNVFVVVK